MKRPGEERKSDVRQRKAERVNHPNMTLFHRPTTNSADAPGVASTQMPAHRADVIPASPP